MVFFKLWRKGEPLNSTSIQIGTQKWQDLTNQVTEYKGRTERRERISWKMQQSYSCLVRCHLLLRRCARQNKKKTEWNHPSHGRNKPNLLSLITNWWTGNRKSAPWTLQFVDDLLGKITSNITTRLWPLRPLNLASCVRFPLLWLQTHHLNAQTAQMVRRQRGEVENESKINPTMVGCLSNTLCKGYTTTKRQPMSNKVAHKSELSPTKNMPTQQLYSGINECTRKFHVKYMHCQCIVKQFHLRYWRSGSYDIIHCDPKTFLFEFANVRHKTHRCIPRHSSSASAAAGTSASPALSLFQDMHPGLLNSLINGLLLQVPTSLRQPSILASPKVRVDLEKLCMMQQARTVHVVSQLKQ